MTRSRQFIPHWTVALFLSALAARPVAHDVVLCEAPGNQANPIAVADGKGGAIVAWADSRNSGYDIDAQHLLGSGRVDGSWPSQGLGVCEAQDDQAAPTIVSDRRGGAIVAWFDQRGGKDHDIYAQRVLNFGQLDPTWPKNGAALCTAPGHQQAPYAVSDGSGGAIVTWFDYRDGTEAHIYAQHVLASGTVDERWSKDGIALCLAHGSQFFPKAIPDSAGGAIVTWYDKRAGSTYDIYAQRVLSTGLVDPRWPVNGRALCTARNDQRYPVLIGDGHGGAMVAWEDAREDVKKDVYAQHVLGSGLIDPVWPDDGRAVVAGAGAQHRVALASDGAGGAFVVWEDDRGDDPNIFAHHLLGSGALEPRWPATGHPLCVDPGAQEEPVIEGDGQGSAVVAWRNLGNGTDYDLAWAPLTMKAAATLRAPIPGRPLCVAPGHQIKPALTRVARGVVVAVWEDSRKGSESDLRALRLDLRGATSGKRRTSPRELAR